MADIWYLESGAGSGLYYFNSIDLKITGFLGMIISCTTFNRLPVAEYL
jgi:hypothetical protein